MVTIARFGMFAIAAIAAVAVALPHMLATGNAAPVTHVAVPAVPLLAAGAGDTPVRLLQAPPPRLKKRQPALRYSNALEKPQPAPRHSNALGKPQPAPRHSNALEIDHLPKLAPYSLPPRLKLRARAHAPAGRHLLEQRVLHSSHLALSPVAKRAVRHHLVAPGALALLLHTPHLGSPLLVFSARGRSVEVQATRMWMTRSTLISLGRLSVAARPASLRLQPVTSSSTDVHARHGGMLGPQAVAIAKRYLGIPYVWGGSTPTGGFDCSGLVMYVYRQLGISLDHYAAWQFLEGTRIAEQDLQPGDLVFFEPKADGPGHVGMYVGDGKMINAPHTGDVVRIVSIQGRSGYVGAVRPY
jgi:cell wall-associated NlpC family hydrolase